MKQYQCLITCYASLLKGEKLRLFDAGELVPELPSDYVLPDDLKGKFVCLNGEEEEKDSVDLGLATEELLMSQTLQFKPLAEYAKTHYGYELLKANKKKEDLVKEFLDAREKHQLSGSNPNAR